MAAKFAKAVDACDHLKPHRRPGKQALKAIDASRIVVDKPGDLNGSVDVDSALRTKWPQANRWDYSIGHGAKAAEIVHWVEIHPATAGEVKLILAKLAWLQSWLAEHAPELRSIPGRFVWIASGSTSISPNSPDRKRLAQRGITLVGSNYRIR